MYGETETLYLSRLANQISHTPWPVWFQTLTTADEDYEVELVEIATDEE